MPDFGPALGAFIDEEGVLVEAEFAEGVLAAGGDWVDEVVLAEGAEDGDVGQVFGLEGFLLLFLYFFMDLLHLLLLLKGRVDFDLLLHSNQLIINKYTKER